MIETFTQMCDACHQPFTSDVITNLCTTCAGKVFMGQYSKVIADEPSVKELLELSTLYHDTIVELADLFGVSLTPTNRVRAFQIMKDMGDELKMKVLANVVLNEVRRDQ